MTQQAIKKKLATHKIKVKESNMTTSNNIIYTSHAHPDTHKQRDKLKTDTHKQRDKLKTDTHKQRDKLKTDTHKQRDKLKTDAPKQRDKLKLKQTARRYEKLKHREEEDAILHLWLFGVFLFHCRRICPPKRERWGELGFCGMRGYQAEVLIELCFSQRAIMQAIKMYFGELAK